MLNTDPELKNLYKSDSIDKNLILDFYRPGFDEPFLHIGGTGNIMGETMEIDESMSSGQNIEFGSCEASQLKVTLVDVHESVKGTYVSVYQTLDGIYPDTALFPGTDLHPSGYTMPLGKYVVQSAERQANRKYRDLVALDFMGLFDVNVIDWYNSLTFPMTLRQFRASLCRHIGVTEEIPDYLPNDDMLVDKTIDTEELIGRDVLIACEQANGAFGHFDRNGVLQHVVLQPNDRLVPSMDLLPDDGLYPQAPGDMNTQIYDEQLDPYLLISCIFEEHTVKSIDKVQIRQEEGDIGAIYGTGTNAYTVEGNFLMYGKNADQLAEIAQNIYGMVSGRMYIPFESESKGLPYLEVGDAARFEFGSDFIVSYIIKRTLKGIYALRDSYSATGEEIRSTESNINTEIIQLKGKSAIFKKSVEEVSANLTDLEKNTESQFKITADQIVAEVKRAKEAEASLTVEANRIATNVTNLENNTNSKIEQLSSQISLKVSQGDLVSAMQMEVNKEGASITFETGHFIVKGQNFYVNADGSGGAANGNLTWDTNGKITVKGATIEGALVSSTSSSSVISAATLLASKCTINDSFSVKCYASMSDIGANTIRCGKLYGDVNPFSDSRLKRNVKNISPKIAEQIIKELRAVSFEFRKSGDASMGFIAQEVKEICAKHKIDLPLYGLHDGYYTVPYMNYISLMVPVLQKLLREVEELKQCIK